jgi:hypothetical protein
VCTRAPLLEPLRPRASAGRGPRLLAFAGAALLIVMAVFAAVLLLWSSVHLGSDPEALARIELDPLAGTFVRARAFGPKGHAIPLTVRGGRLTPSILLAPGERVSVEVTVRRPGWLGWALGKERHKRLTLVTPTVSVTDRWLTTQPGSRPRVRFDEPVRKVAYGRRGHLVRHAAGRDPRELLLDRHAPAGTVELAAAVRSWERLGGPVSVSWFPPSAEAQATTSPAAGATITPVTPIRVTVSRPLASVLGHRPHPALSPSVPGLWTRTDSHTLTFTPARAGIPLGTQLELGLPSGVKPAAGGEIQWSVPHGSTLRLQQLLARARYLPLEWSPDSRPVARNRAAQLRAAVDPPDGHFEWRYPKTPGELKRLWAPGHENVVTRGALMMFERTHHLAVDGLAGPRVWNALISDTIAGKERTGGYSYVYVHRAVPQRLTLWHSGHTTLTSAGNTGVPKAPTELGTFPVFEHIQKGTMSGTNPDGSHYRDPGVRWISYFNGGDAIHAFPRASYGTPQSLGCVELPLAAARKVWPYTPIGTLVTIEE